MKIYSKFCICSFLMILVSCGSLKLSPGACHSQGIWGTPFDDGRAANEESFTKEYYVWSDDREVKLQDFLKEKKIKCSEIKKIRVQLQSVFFVKRKLTVFIQK